ncbi:MAG: ATP-binding protein [Candidatus Dormibacteria bacterium]
MDKTTSELRIPAQPEYILVAKRAAAGFACVAGFDVEGIDDVVIAVAQACQNAIACCERSGGCERAELRITFSIKDHRLEMQVRSMRGPGVMPALHEHGPTPSETAAVAARKAADRRRAAEQTRAEAEAATDLALRVMGLFVDDYGYRLDERTGGLRVRLTKYRVR